MPVDRYIYVIDLDREILKNKKFMAKNPNYQKGKPCVYVGMSAHPPEKRFRQHKEGYRAAKFVKKYGKCLKPRHYKKLNPMSYEEACRMEVEKARLLRKRGYAVWQN